MKIELSQEKARSRASFLSVFTVYKNRFIAVKVQQILRSVLVFISSRIGSK